MHLPEFKVPRVTFVSTSFQRKMPFVFAGILEECNKEDCRVEPKKGGLFATAAIKCKYTAFSGARDSSLSDSLIVTWDQVEF